MRPQGSLPSPFGLLDPGPGLSLPGGIPGRCHLGGRCSASPADASRTQGPLAARPTTLPRVPTCPVKAVRPLEGWHVCQGQALGKVLPLGLPSPLPPPVPPLCAILKKCPSLLKTHSDLPFCMGPLAQRSAGYVPCEPPWDGSAYPPAQCLPWSSWPGIQGAELAGFPLHHVMPCATCDGPRTWEAPSSPPPDSQPEQPQGRGQRQAPPL